MTGPNALEPAAAWYFYFICCSFFAHRAKMNNKEKITYRSAEGKDADHSSSVMPKPMRPPSIRAKAWHAAAAPAQAQPDRGAISSPTRPRASLGTRSCATLPGYHVSAHHLRRAESDPSY